MFASLQQLVQHFENPAGDPTALNYRYDATHTASGLYQITDTTWAGYGGYSSAAAAPPDVQTAKFADLVQHRGLADWTCPGCNPALNSYLASNPDAANLPALAAGGGGTSTAGSGTNHQGTFWDWLTSGGGTGAEMPTNTYPDPNGIFGGASGAAPEGPGKSIVNGLNAVAGPGTWIDQITGWLGSVAARGALFVLAIVFIVGALILFGLKSGIETETGGGN